MYFGINKFIQSIKPGNVLISFIAVLLVILIFLSINCSNNDTKDLSNTIHFPVGITYQEETITDIFKDTLLVTDWYYSYDFDYVYYGVSWGFIEQEIDADRPFVLSAADFEGGGDHAVCVYGYNDSTNELHVHDTHDCNSHSNHNASSIEELLFCYIHI